MAKLKIEKNDVWIDMTPMSDVMVLLLTFFMLSANFVKNEVVKVVTPASKNVDKVPATATLDIMIAPDTVNKGQPDQKVIGRVYLGTDKVATIDSALCRVLTKDDNDDISKKAKAISENAELRKLFLAETQIGIPIENYAEFLKKPHEEKVTLMKAYGVPLDSIDGGPSQFQRWVKAIKQGYKLWREDYVKDMPEKDAAEVPDRLDICIKADRNTPYITFKTVISELQDILESRYKLVTQFKKGDE